MHIVNIKDLLVQSMVVLTVKNCKHIKKKVVIVSKGAKKGKKKQAG